MNDSFASRWRSCGRLSILMAIALVGSCKYESFVLPETTTAPKTYTIHELGVPAGGTQSQANSGSATAVVGWGILTGTAHHAAAFAGGAAIMLQEPAGTTASEARGVNDAGVVCGFAQIAGVRHAYIWPTATATAVPVALPSLGGTYTFARNINSSGVIAGASQETAGDTVVVIWTPASGGGYTVERLHPLLGQNFGVAAINNAGQVAGNQPTGEGFLWDDDDGMINIDTPEGGDDDDGVDVNGMNNLGIVAGNYGDETTGDDRSFVYTGTSGAVPLGPPPTGYTGVAAGGLSDDGWVFAQATGVNSGGQAVGVAVVGTIVDSASTWTVLPSLTGTIASPQDNAVNTCGVIFGYATKAASATVRYAVAWVPQGCTIP